MVFQVRWQLILAVCLSILSGQVSSDEWRSEPLSAIDQQYMEDQQEAIDALARRHFGRQLNGEKLNDLAVLQRLLDDGLVAQQDVRTLQAMGIVLGEVLRREHGLNWVVYYDQYGRSRSLQLPGFAEDFIFPVTQISRLAEVGASVDVKKIYRELEQAITDIKISHRFSFLQRY